MKVALIGIDLLMFVLVIGLGSSAYLLWSGEFTGADTSSLVYQFSKGLIPLVMLLILRPGVKRGQIGAVLLTLGAMLGIGGLYLYGFALAGFPQRALPYLGPTAVIFSIVGLAWWLAFERDDAT